ncbi:Alpha-L-rhamnosidase [Mycena venus]|uniref:Alpha-L-rhamnosidase n=1 Tax=Mycena venus TaxID=2733690 RepID=A0A8H6YNG1_9AGAR|nr:Alpha-L-rhamnosidase [Mycena venus]
MKTSVLLSLTLLSAVTVWGQPSGPLLDFEGAEWIWGSEMANGKASIISRPFRKVFTAPQGKIPIYVQAITTADDGHELYINGKLLAKADDLQHPQAACALLNPGPIVFGLIGTNTGGVAALLAKFRVTYSDGTTFDVVTDNTWKGGAKLTKGFETLAFDDSGWGFATSVGEYGVDPWKRLHPAQAIPRCPQYKPVESEFECSAGANTIGYLSAVPGVGCVCLPQRTLFYCGSPSGGVGVQKCSDKTGSDGQREIKCDVECSPGLVATDQNTCSAPGSCPAGCVHFDCAIDKAKQESKDEEERRAREEARQEREEARKAREAEQAFREEQRAAMKERECQTEHNAPPSPPPVSDLVPEFCSLEPFTVGWSSPTSKCGCTSTFNQAKRRDPNAVQCLPPANHGRAACERTGPASSRCNIICDDGFQLTPDERDCVATARDETKSEFECSADAENPGFLTADPVLGCICAHAKTDNFCGVSTGDPDAEMMCSDTTDSWGHRNVKCQVQCSQGFAAKDQKTCKVVGDDCERPSIQDAPAIADAGMQELIKQTTERLDMDLCPMGYAWDKIDTGYRCQGGTHFLSFAQLGME